MYIWPFLLDKTDFMLTVIRMDWFKIASLSRIIRIKKLGVHRFPIIQSNYCQIYY